MPSSSSVLPAAAKRKSIRPLWSLPLQARPRGLVLAREKGWLLAWDEKHWLYLVNRSGAKQAQVHFPASLATACAAEDGSSYAAAGSNGEVLWLAPDLTVRWQQTVNQRVLAMALDPFGQYLAVSEARGHLHYFDRYGRPIGHVQSPRPLHHLAFIPAAPFLLGAADYGLVARFDLMGRCLWVDGLVAHIGALTVSGDGDRLLLACFTEGLQRYNLLGKNQGRIQVAEPCRLASQSFDGRLILVAGLSNRLLLLDREGRLLCEHLLEKPAGALALCALGEGAVVALSDGRVLGLEVRDAKREG
jgi:hypothetical protein